MIVKLYYNQTDTYRVYMDEVNHICISGHLWGMEALRHYFGVHSDFVYALPVSDADDYEGYIKSNN